MLSLKKQVKGTFWILSSVFFGLIQTCIKTSTAVWVLDSDQAV